MPPTALSREQFLQHKQGRTFADIANDRDAPFGDVLEFFSDSSRQRRMEEAEVHHDRPPLAGVVRELESQEKIRHFLTTAHPRRTQRLRQAIGVVVRIVMERRGWRKTGRKGSLGVRSNAEPGSPVPGSHHNTGGLAFWFLRAERYQLVAGMPYRSVREQSQQLKVSQSAAVANPAGHSQSSDVGGTTPRRTRSNGTPLSIEAGR